MQAKFPKSREAWKNDVERRLNRLRADFAMLWRLMPQTPEWPGIPMSGPLSPLPFEWFPTVNTGGTVNTLGTYVPSGTQFGLPSRVIVGVSGVTNGSQSCCTDLNGNISCIYNPGPGFQYDNFPAVNICGFRIRVTVSTNVNPNLWQWGVSFLRNVAPSAGSSRNYLGTGPAGSVITCNFTSGSVGGTCNLPASVTVQSQ